MLHPHNSAALEAPRGGFDLLLNPLVLLGVAPTATARDVNRAYEDAVEVGTAEIDLLHRAQQALLVPRLRIDAEVGGFLNVAPNEVTQLTEKLRTGAVRDDLNDLITNLAALPKSNVLAHLVARFPARASELIELIEAQAAITADAVYDAVTAARAQSRIGRVDSETVVHAISRLEERQIKAAIDKLLEESAFADSFTAFVRRALRTESEMIIGKLDVYVRAYSNAVSPEFSRRRERVTAACDALRANPKDLESTDRLLNALRHWNEIAEPLQMYEGHMLRDEPFTRGIYEQVRSLCIWLNDTQEEYKLPHTITLACIAAFKALPRAVEQMREHTEIYAKNLSAQQTIAATRREMGASFAAQNWQRALALIDQLLALERDTTEIDALRKMRDVCNRKLLDWSHPSAARPYDMKVELSNAGVTFSGRKDELGSRATKEQIRAGQSTQKSDHEASEASQEAYQAAKGRKDEVGSRTTKESTAAAQSTKTKGTEQPVQQRATWANRFVEVRNELLLMILWGAFISFIMMLPPPSQPVPKAPTPQAQSAAGPPNTSSPASTEEERPTVGGGNTHALGNVRHCLYQEIRIRAAKSLASGQGDLAEFEALARDWSSRCASRAYPADAKSLVDNEIADPHRRASLEAQGRALADSWTSRRRALGQRPSMPSPTPSPAPPPVTCASPPNNGRFLSGYLKAGSGHTIEFRNEQENDLVAKVRNAKSGRVAGSFFVSAKSTALFEGLPDGRYVIQYATGGRLAPDCRSFLEVLAVLQYRDVDTVYEIS